MKLWNGTAWDIYYHNGTAWRLNGSTENQNATVVFPDEGMFVVHRKSRTVKLFFAGVVPTTVQKTELPGPATRFAANRFPVRMTLLNSGIAALPGWRLLWSEPTTGCHYKSSSSRAGFSRQSLILTRNVTASFPSTTR